MSGLGARRRGKGGKLLGFVDVVLGVHCFKAELESRFRVREAEAPG